VPPTKSETDKTRKAETDKASEKIAEARKAGLLPYLLTAFGAGALALLTPCVFPMIPITVSFFTKRKHISRSRAIRDAGIYSLGIIFTFTALGFLFALLMGATGIQDFASNPWVNLFVAAVFILLAGSLFGFYEIQLPTGVLNKLNAKANEGEGILSVLLMGLVFSLTSFTCTVPFVGAVMVSATRGDWLWPMMGMLAFATAFSIPFFLLALFPAALKSLPKSGGWLNSVKVLMGFLEIAAAMKYLSNADLVWQWALLTRSVFLVIWVVLAVLAVLYLIGRIKFVHDTPVEKLSGVRMLTATGFLSIAVFLTTGIFGGQLGVLEGYVPLQTYASDKEWLENYEAGLKLAKETGKPIFVDFTGYTCTNCRAMEATMFTRPEVAALLSQYVRVRLHTDGRANKQQIEENRENQKMQQDRYDTIALPYYAAISPEDKDIVQFDGYTNSPAEFVTFLKKGLPEKQAAAK
jgi:thiol:disulfide interchange protein